MAVLTLAQTLAQMPFLILSAVDVVNSGERFSEPADMVDTIMGTFNDKYRYGRSGYTPFSIMP